MAKTLDFDDFWQFSLFWTWHRLWRHIHVIQGVMVLTWYQWPEPEIHSTQSTKKKKKKTRGACTGTSDEKHRAVFGALWTVGQVMKITVQKKKKKTTTPTFYWKKKKKKKKKKTWYWIFITYPSAPLFVVICYFCWLCTATFDCCILPVLYPFHWSFYFDTHFPSSSSIIPKVPKVPSSKVLILDVLRPLHSSFLLNCSCISYFLTQHIKKWSWSQKCECFAWYQLGQGI